MRFYVFAVVFLGFLSAELVGYLRRLGASLSVWGAIVLYVVAGIPDIARGQAGVISDPLRISECNSRYFSDAEGRAIYLTGMHTWTNFQDRADVSTGFDYDAYLDQLQRYHHNFIRLWVTENASWAPWTDQKIMFDPLPYLRTGSGSARDGLPKFDLTKFNEQYFERLRQRVIDAQDKGIYVAVMLFNGFSIEKKEEDKRSWWQRAFAKLYKAIGMDPAIWDPNNPWNGHPFHWANNTNGVNGDMNSDGEGLEIHTLKNAQTLKLQEQYVRKVIDTLNDLNNVLYEVSNESRGESTEWQHHIVRVIHEYENTKPKQHPVLMTAQWPGGSDSFLFRSPAQAVSPGKAYRDDPPPADGNKVIIADTDHLWGEGGDSQWVWKSFMRGLNPIFMDRIASLTGHPDGDIPSADETRVALGYSLMYSQTLDLNNVVPRGDLCSTAYCLANPGVEYLAYLPSGGPASIDLKKKGELFTIEWFNLDLGKAVEGSPVLSSGGWSTLVAPFQGPALVRIKSTNTAGTSLPCRNPSDVASLKRMTNR
jgi:hypothetical protein